MLNHIKRFIAFLLPILRSASIQIAADTINDVAYGPRPRRPFMRPDGYARYSEFQRRQPTTQREAVRNVGRAVREADEFGKYKMPHKADQPFHDVIMVAFDITGPNVELVKEYLMETVMPVTGKFEHEGAQFNLDSCWIADDTVGNSDCHSAVFVPKGTQAQARRILTEHGLGQG